MYAHNNTHLHFSPEHKILHNLELLAHSKRFWIGLGVIAFAAALLALAIAFGQGQGNLEYQPMMPFGPYYMVR